LGFPIFQYFDLATCSFTWSSFIDIILDQPEIAITYRSDYGLVAFAFVVPYSSTNKDFRLGLMQTSGAVIRSWGNYGMSLSTKIRDLYFDLTNN
jgi:hypothetical protein